MCMEGVKWERLKEKYPFCCWVWCRSVTHSTYWNLVWLRYSWTGYACCILVHIHILFIYFAIFCTTQIKLTVGHSEEQTINRIFAPFKKKQLPQMISCSPFAKSPKACWKKLLKLWAIASIGTACFSFCGLLTRTPVPLRTGWVGRWDI